MTGTLNQYLPANLFAVMLVFSRIGSAVMVLPGFGDLYVPARFRLLLGLFFAMLLATALSSILPAQPGSPLVLMSLLGGEIVIGLFIGSVARLMLSALETAGAIVSLQLGLSAAQIFNPLQAQQTAIAGAFLTVFGVLLISSPTRIICCCAAWSPATGCFPRGVSRLCRSLRHGDAARRRLVPARRRAVGAVHRARHGVLRRPRVSRAADAAAADLLRHPADPGRRRARRLRLHALRRDAVVPRRFRADREQHRAAGLARRDVGR